jgi:hypothetical protein
LFVLESEGDKALDARYALAGDLRALAAAARDLSDRLSMRHFSHTGAATRSLAA